MNDSLFPPPVVPEKQFTADPTLFGIPGVVLVMSWAEAHELGVFQEVALSDEAAWDANWDPADPADRAAVDALKQDREITP